MEITRFTCNPFQELTYVLWDKKSLQCAIIDPGCLTDDEQERLSRFIADNRLSVKHLLLTHLHIDHYYGAPFVVRTYHVGVEANAAEKPLLDMMQQQAIAFGTPPPADILPITRYLADGDTLYIGDEPLQVIGAAGHSPGGIAFYAPESGFVCSGDSLFCGSIGRTDFIGGNYEQLIESLHKGICSLPPETVVYPGHGPETTIGDELRHNPFL